MRLKSNWLCVLMVLALGLPLIASCAPASPTASIPATTAPGAVETVAPVTSAPATSVSAPATSQPVHYPDITVWIWSGPEGDAMTATAAAYTAQTGNKVTVSPLGRDDWSSKIQSNLVGGSDVPDLWEVGSDNVPSYAAGGFIAPFDNYIKNNPDYHPEDFGPGIQTEITYQNNTYELPTDIATQLLFYRKDLIPQPPKDYAEYLAIAQKFTQSVTPASQTKYGLAFTAAPYTSERNWLSVLWANGGDVLDKDGNVIVNSPTAVQSLTWWVNLHLKDNVTPPDIATYEYPQILTALQEGVVAMGSEWNAAAPTLFSQKDSPKVFDKMAVAPNPSGPNGPYVYAYVLGLAMNSRSPNKEAAAAFGMWASGREGGLAYTKAGGNNPRPSVLSNPDMLVLRPWNPDLQKALETSKGTIRHPKAGEMYTVIRKYLSMALVGQLSPQQALDTMARELKTIVGK